jgi:hypothetical protein
MSKRVVVYAKHPNFPFCTYQGLESYLWEAWYVWKQLSQKLWPTLSLSLSLARGQGSSHFSIFISESRIVSFFLYPLRLAAPSQVQGGRAWWDGFEGGHIYGGLCSPAPCTGASPCPSIGTQVQVLHWLFKAHYASQLGGKQAPV